MEYIGILVCQGVCMILAFYMGCKVTQKVYNGDKITKEDLEVVKLPKFKEKRTIEMENADILLNNIENYDGYGGGQKDFK